MMKYKFGFIGCGNMGGALCTAVAKKESDAAICVCDGVKEKTDALCARFSNLTAVSLTDLDFCRHRDRSKKDSRNAAVLFQTIFGVGLSP